MKCLICHKNYINLGVHVKRKHMSCDEYRREFNLPLGTPLADKELCELFSVSALQRLKDPVWLEECSQRMKGIAKENTGKKTGPLNLPEISKRRLMEMNKQTGESYRAQMVPVIKDDYMAGMTPIEIRRKHGVAPMTLQDWVRRGLLPKRLLSYSFAANTPHSMPKS